LRRFRAAHWRDRGGGPRDAVPHRCRLLQAALVPPPLEWRPDRFDDCKRAIRSHRRPARGGEQILRRHRFQHEGGANPFRFSLAIRIRHRRRQHHGDARTLGPGTDGERDASIGAEPHRADQNERWPRPQQPEGILEIVRRRHTEAGRSQRRMGEDPVNVIGFDEQDREQ
jgi:hypothetical protein